MGTRSYKIAWTALFVITSVAKADSPRGGDRFQILLFSKTAGFRHGSIPSGIAAIQQLGIDHEFGVDATEDATAFDAVNLAQYEAVVFLSTTGDVLNATQEAAFEAYVQSSGGYVGIHAASDTEHTWAWYGGLVGAYFDNHPAIQNATVIVADRVHPSSQSLPPRWVRNDEWYNFQTNPRGAVHVLATLDEVSYSGGTQGFDHPIAWCQGYDGGRSWYTGGGHTNASFTEPQFMDHILGGIEWAAGAADGDCGATIESNFQKVVLEADTIDPMELEVAPDGRVFFIERAGNVRIHKPSAGVTVLAGQLSVFTGLEDGLLGIALDPGFASNGWVYLYYSPIAPSVNRLSRFAMNGDTLDLLSEQMLLEVSTQRDECCHAAGSLAFGPDGSLYLSTGDNTNPFESDKFTPIDERVDRSAFDAQKSSSNVDDLRGKILRIQPQSNGSYTIPPGNLFPTDGSAGRPEILAMGCRNPFRISIDAETGWLYWGEVGPDAATAEANRGPAGYDEVNQARGAGNFGWPYCIADNVAYNDYDFDTEASGAMFDCANPVNDSPNNTGAANLPPSEPAMIWYPYGASAEFPELSGPTVRAIMAGPVYHDDPGRTSTVRMPAYYDKTLFIYDWMREWIKEIKLDDNGDLLKINPFMPNVVLEHPMDMEVGPDGAIYMVEWGQTFQGNNNDAQIIRIEYTRDCTLDCGDIDGSGGNVSLVDFASFALCFGRPPTASMACLCSDLNRDGAVSLSDFATFALVFGSTSTNSIPNCP